MYILVDLVECRIRDLLNTIYFLLLLDLLPDVVSDGGPNFLINLDIFLLGESFWETILVTQMVNKLLLIKLGLQVFHCFSVLGHKSLS